MSGGVTEALRGWIRAYDLWLNEGEGEAPTVDSLCEVCERIVRCRDCRHGHITIDGESCKWCDLIATHDPDGNEPNNGYDPEPYFDADFFCAWGELREG